MPRGISVNCASVRDWALRNGVALRKLVASLNGYVCLFSVLSYLMRGEC